MMLKNRFPFSLKRQHKNLQIRKLGTVTENKLLFCCHFKTLFSFSLDLSESQVQVPVSFQLYEFLFYFS